jgi:phosphoglycolate phosphatase
MADQFGALKAVVFDFDGTLFDSYEAITASVNHVRAAHGLPPLGEPEVRRHVGRGPLYLLEHTVPGSDPAADVARYRAHHPSVMFTGTRLLDGAADVLRALKATGRLVALCSNKPRGFSTELLAYLGLAGLVDQVLGPEDVPRPKAAPDMLIAALDRLGVPAAKALYVGDMVVDIQTARGAGVRVWVVPTGSDDRATLERAGPDRILHDLCEMATLFGRSQESGVSSQKERTDS